MTLGAGVLLLNINCVFWLSLSESFLILRRNGQNMIINVYLSLSTVSNFMTTCSVGGELFHVHGQMYRQMIKLNSHFSVCSLMHLKTTMNHGHYKYCLSLIFNRKFLADDV